MELKDLILETINEISLPSDPLASESSQVQLVSSPSQTGFSAPQGSPAAFGEAKEARAYPQSKEALREECEFLEMLQERLLVLFDGLNAPQNKNTTERLNITINFLEYQLSVIQERLNDLKK